MNYGSEVPNVVVMTVCTDVADTSALVRAVGKKPWALSLSHFDTYVSSSRRPSSASQIKAASLCLAFVDFDKSTDSAVETTQYLSQTFTGKITIIAVSGSLDPARILMAMRTGCSEFLVKPLNEAALTGLLNKIDDSWSSSIKRVVQTGSVISFFGAKGGVGATTLAVHLAAYLAQCHKKRTLLIDHHLEMGHVCIYLGVDGENCHLHEVIRNVNRLDSELLGGYVTKHRSGVEVLSSPNDANKAMVIDAQTVSRVLDFFRSEYDYVIIDADIHLDQISHAIIRSSSIAYLVGTPEISAVRDLSSHIDRLTSKENFSEKIQVVINRFNSSYAINFEQIEKMLKVPISIKISTAYLECVNSTNLGEPISPSSKSEIAGQMGKWAADVAGSAGIKTSVRVTQNLFSRWKK
ncbi:AAA family ATPase [Granulicella sp. WH15]|uniref:response regulator n=1 Tax=Granulicella sp. WH15 TaxID=2602070 RepID=UPI0013677D23|nr:AAA family ATPase [Granulicella sp. WH15]QHN02691.1 AAA family ATPase [Granulicella sp. WH15]